MENSHKDSKTQGFHKDSFIVISPCPGALMAKKQNTFTILTMLLEVPVFFDISKGLNVQSAGAHRIELCASMAEGDITTSHDMIIKAKELLKISFFVMISPGGCDFTYSDEEFQIVKKDI